MELILVYIITFSLRYVERAARWLFYPNDDMILAEWEQLQTQQKRRSRGDGGGKTGGPGNGIGSLPPASDGIELQQHQHIGKDGTRDIAAMA